MFYRGQNTKFVTNTGENLEFEKIFVIESKRNASFSYNLVENDYFSFNKNSSISIIGFNKNQDLVLFNKKNFKKALETNSAFVGEEMPNVSIDELKRLILNI